MNAPRVKPLVWQNDMLFCGQPHAYADTPLGPWTVTACDGRGGRWAYDDPSGDTSDMDWPTREEAQAAAQTDYETRIRAALEPQDAPAMAGVEIPAGYTPGPWRAHEVHRPPIGFGPHDTDANGNIFCGYSIWGSDEHGASILPTIAAVHNFPDQVAANARLIALAPAMAEELVALREKVAALKARAEVMHRRAQRAEGALDAAIADGEGWQSLYARKTRDDPGFRMALGGIMRKLKSRRAAITPKAKS